MRNVQLNDVGMKKGASYFAIGVAAIVVGTACSAELDQTDAARLDVDTQVTQDDGGTGCGKLSEPARLNIEWLDATDASRSVRVSNPGNVDGVVTLTQTVISADGAKSTELAKMSIGAGQSLVVPVSAPDPASGANPSSLHVTGKAEFADGSRGWDTVKSGLFAESLADAKPLTPASPIVTHALVTKRLCFRYPGSFGADQGEDYFDEGVPTIRPARGMRVTLLNGLGTIQHEFVLDRDGCSPSLQLRTGLMFADHYTEGEIDNGQLDVVDIAQDGEVQRFGFGFIVADSTSTQTVNFDPTASAAADAFNVFQAAAWTLRRVWEGQSAGVTIRVNDPTTQSSYFNEVIKLEVGDHDNKWTIAHELGHWVMDQLTDTPETSACGSDGHGRSSIENQRCALSEGFGNNIAATAFNLTGISNCSYAGVDCDEGLTTGGNCSTKGLLWKQLMETCAPDLSPWSGLGNETDWSRVLWNMRSPATGLGTTQLTDWIRTANDSTAWTDTNVYTLLNNRANAIGGTLNSLFDTHKVAHGIDHP
jgi:hypothetical protein